MKKLLFLFLMIFILISCNGICKQETKCKYAVSDKSGAYIVKVRCNPGNCYVGCRQADTIVNNSNDIKPAVSLLEERLKEVIKIELELNETGN